MYQASQVVQKHFMMVHKSFTGTGLLHMMEKYLFGAFPLQKKLAAAAKKKQQKNKNGNKQSIHARKTH